LSNGGVVPVDDLAPGHEEDFARCKEQYHIGDGSAAALKLPLPNASAALMMAWMKNRACQAQAAPEQRGHNGAERSREKQYRREYG
jgi:hypothetical protein